MNKLKQYTRLVVCTVRLGAAIVTRNETAGINTLRDVEDAHRLMGHSHYDVDEVVAEARKQGGYRWPFPGERK